MCCLDEDKLKNLKKALNTILEECGILGRFVKVELVGTREKVGHTP
jgi:hypothetical protein